MPPTTGFSLGIRGRILTLFGFCIAVLLAAAAYGFWQYAASVQLFDRDVRASQANAIEVLTVETNFKKQVQEWKDTLLRGKKPEALDKHWSAFQQRESDVRNATERMRSGVTDAEASQLIGQFVAAHQQMGEAYRRGLQAFKDRGFDSAVGDAAVAGIDRAPTELLGKAKARFIAVADQDARLASEGAHQTGWMVTWLLAFSAVAGAVIFMVAVNRTISRPLMGVVGSIGELAEGNTATDVPGQERSDEIGKVASAIQILKEKMIQAEHMKADRAAAELRATEQRKSDMLRLADDFENAVGRSSKRCQRPPRNSRARQVRSPAQPNARRSSVRRSPPRRKKPQATFSRSRPQRKNCHRPWARLAGRSTRRHALRAKPSLRPRPRPSM
jgi:HAMP domain-containing protein